MRHALYVSLLTALFLCLPTHVFADVQGTSPSPESAQLPSEPLNQCAQLVQDCFTSQGMDRTNCFFSSANHPFCEGTSLGRLTYKRWIMSPVRPTGAEAPSEFLGPHLVDQICLGNFDNTWLSKLIAPSTLQADIEMLESKLAECTKEISDQLTRP